MARKRKLKRRTGRTGELTIKERQFVKEYLVDFNATRAYIASHPTVNTIQSAGVAGCGMMKNPKIKSLIDEEIRKKMAVIDVKSDMIVAQLRDLVFMDIRQFYNEDGSFRDLSELNVSQQAAIESFEVEELFDGRGKDREWIGRIKKVKLYSRLKSTELLMKYFGMLQDVNINVNNNVISLRIEVEKLKREYTDDDLFSLRDVLKRFDKNGSALAGASGNGSGRKTLN